MTYRDRMIALSVLDLAVVRANGTSADALRETTTLAVRADELGFVRFWVAEHHNLATVASTVPSVLIAHLALATKRIRVGSGGVMLPNHAPISIAEQFALLEALHPGRIDLGIGRAPGTDQLTAAAFGRNLATSVDEFPRNVIDVMGLLGDQRGDEGLWKRVRATPRHETTPMIALLGSSGYSAQLAGLLGVPFAYAHHFDTGSTEVAARLYRDRFTPSAVLDKPHLIVTVGALAAESVEEAERIGLPGRILRYGIRTNSRAPLISPQDAVDHPDALAARQMPTDQLLGDKNLVVEGLRLLAQRTEADELMLSAATFDVTDRVRSLELIKSAWS